MMEHQQHGLMRFTPELNWKMLSPKKSNGNVELTFLIRIIGPLYIEGTHVYMYTHSAEYITIINLVKFRIMAMVSPVPTYPAIGHENS